MFSKKANLIGESVANEMNQTLKEDRFIKMFDPNHKIKRTASTLKEDPESLTEETVSVDLSPELLDAVELVKSSPKAIELLKEYLECDETVLKSDEKDLEESLELDEALEDEDEDLYQEASDGLLTASAALDTLGFAKGATLSLQLASLVVEAKKKNDKIKSNSKSGSGSKASKKPAPKKPAAKKPAKKAPKSSRSESSTSSKSSSGPRSNSSSTSSSKSSGASKKPLPKKRASSDSSSSDSSSDDNVDLVRMTYGEMPSRELFDKHFDSVCPSGYCRIENDKRLGSVKLTADELWEQCELAILGGTDRNLDWISSVLSCLRFEWV